MKTFASVPKVSLAILVFLGFASTTKIGSIFEDELAQVEADKRGRSKLLSGGQSKLSNSRSCSPTSADYKACLCRHYPQDSSCNTQRTCTSHDNCIQANSYLVWCNNGQCTSLEPLAAECIQNYMITCTDDSGCANNDDNTHCCGGRCQSQKCPDEDPQIACSDTGFECFHNINNVFCCKETHLCQLREDTCNYDPNPQKTCSPFDGGAACLRNEDDRTCCGGECRATGSDGCLSCMLDSDCILGYHCCKTDNTCQPLEISCTCASQGDCQSSQECCNFQCQDAINECINCSDLSCPEGEECCTDSTAPYSFCATTGSCPAAPVDPKACSSNNECPPISPWCCLVSGVGQCSKSYPCPQPSECSQSLECPTVVITEDFNGNVGTQYKVGYCCSSALFSSISYNLCLDVAEESGCTNVPNDSPCQIDQQCASGNCCNGICSATAC